MISGGGETRRPFCAAAWSVAAAAHARARYNFRKTAWAVFPARVSNTM